MSVYFLFIPISWFLFKKYRIFNSEKANILTQPNKKKQKRKPLIRNKNGLNHIS